MIPGVNVTTVDAEVPSGSPGGMDMFFVAGLSEKGPTQPTLIQSYSQFTKVFGKDTGFTDMNSYMKVYFTEGGSRLTFSRVTHSTATPATGVLQDVSPANTVTVNASSTGAWANGYIVDVVTSGPGIKITVKTPGNVLVEESPVFSTKAEVLGWKSEYLSLVDADAAKAIPKVQSITLSSGNDQIGSINDQDYIDAVDLFGSELGPGQLATPGYYSAAIDQAMLDHGASRNRFVLFSASNNTTAVNVLSRQAVITAKNNSQFSALFTPDALIPTDTPGVSKTIPYCVVQAAFEARKTSGFSPAAGKNGKARTPMSLSTIFDEDDRYALNQAGVVVAREIDGVVTTYGYRTLADPSTKPLWMEINGVRTILSIQYEAGLIGERYMFENIDGHGLLMGAFAGELMAMLDRYWKNNDLFGDTAAQAYKVNTGPPVNTLATIANREVNAELYVRTSPFSEQVNIQITKSPLPTDGADPNL